MNKISGILKEEKKVSFAYLFGSFARGDNRDDSDIDVGVFVKNFKGIVPDYELELGLKIEREIGAPVEIVILNDKPLTIITEVLKHGKIIFSRDEKERVKFETFMLSQIQDFNRVVVEFDNMRLKKYGIR